MLHTSTRRRPKQVGQIAAEQPEDPARDGGNVEQVADPLVDQRAAGGTWSSSDERRPHDERQHQQLVGVERESERGNRRK